MSSGLDIEQFYGSLARQEAITSRAAVLTSLQNWQAALQKLVALKTTLDAIVADAVADGEPINHLEKVQADWGANLRNVVTQTFDLNTLAQLLADFSEQGGLEGGPNRIRLAKGQPGAETIIAVSQDA